MSRIPPLALSADATAEVDLTSTSTTAPAQQAHPSSAKISASLLVSAGLLAAVAPIATDLYLPAFPQLAQDLDASAATIQLSLTAFFLGAGIGQVLFGPLSDRIGRKVPLIVGGALFVVFSAAAALAPTAQILIAMRLLQGVTGAAGMVIGRTVIADLAHGREAARAFSALMIVGGVAPVVAPVLGSIGTETVGWRGLLWGIAVLGLLALLATMLFIPETRPAEVRSSASARPSPRHVARELASRNYVGATLAFAGGFATMMAYVSASPFVYQSMMGFSAVQYGIAFAINALLLMAVSAVAMKNAQRFGTARLARIGLGVNAVAILAMAAALWAGLPVIVLVVPIAVAVASLGLVFGTTTALALDSVRDAAGSASAVLGLVQFAFAGLVAPLVGLAGESTAMPMALTMLGATVLANVAVRQVREN